MNKCRYCGSELNPKTIKISSNGWVYCKECKKPYLDVDIQDSDHWVKKHIDEIEKGHYIDMMMEGYI